MFEITAFNKIAKNNKLFFSLKYITPANLLQLMKFKKYLNSICTDRSSPLRIFLIFYNGSLLNSTTGYTRNKLYSKPSSPVLKFNFDQPTSKGGF